MSADTPVQLAFITDAGAIGPTTFAMWTALCRASGPVDVIYVGIDLSEAHWAGVGSVVAGFAQARLVVVKFDDDLLQGVAAPSAHISRATFVRLFLHRFTRGRVLYLDGDIMVTGDVSAIAAVDMADAPIAAVCDFVVQKWAHMLARKERSAKIARKMQRIAPLTVPAGPQYYFNAGVALMDMDRINADPTLVAALEDVQTAAQYPLADQDHLNRVFAGQAHVLAPQWNCSWGRLRLQRRYLADCVMMADGNPATEGPIVIHYHGPKKPWRRVPLVHKLRFARAIWAYRTAQRAFLREFPDFSY
ncbi:Lipopolysaccharide 3-alpha-galactosyltransferase (plasmid) [Ketogulonicigenium robustum]|uniref:Lipopolysaccharide 3-alpha-galactosyltransferase n=1 Tax=Ketogulonicigenium robustum TaxID=92947 RepID=A0A1W6P381_9RHOB|nr:glycosyltransferase [Ketogulonicigenium robustum]ARO15873.1 Lipopolysaccharide 3-alpha-galactosyltransferase [Ketogulonicigenium robustum]